MKSLVALSVLTAVLCVVSGAAMAQGAPNAEAIGWRIGCQAYTFNHFTFFEAVDKVASLGLKWIEAYPGQKLSKETGDAVFDHNMSPELQKVVNDKLKAANVTLNAYGVVDLPGDEAQARKVFDFAKAMGIETITSEPGFKDLPLVSKLADEYAINVAIHNHPKPSKYWNVDTEFEKLQGLSKRVGSCADTGHWIRSGLVSLDCIKKLEGRIISLHLKDLNEASPRAHDVPWGTGITNIKAILEELHRQGFKGLFSAEYEYNWDNSVPELAQCVANVDKMAAEIAAAAKK
ncbi:MAG TPA: sugar phosphate isomerase/epimerase [Candidatus Hydrogenedentes bacterium]|nr:sugar phosphate isomerase/epimerase [Candidatus Hydrogenedentota bacterium]